MKKTFLLVMIAVAVLVSGCAKKSNETEVCNEEKTCCNKTDLFDLSNWNFVLENDAVPACEVFTVKDGVISISGEPLGYMYTKEKYGNYTLELEWRWAGEESNSGIFVLIEEANNPFPKGIEVQLKAGRAGDFVLLAGSDMQEFVLPEGVTERPKFPVIPKREPSNEKPVGEWNQAKIIVQDGVVTVYINDLLQNIGTSAVREGYIGLQSEGKEVQFRNIVIK
jgi:hypothetical protein